LYDIRADWRIAITGHRDACYTRLFDVLGLRSKIDRDKGWRLQGLSPDRIRSA